MQKRILYNRRNSPKDPDKDSEQISTYKNQNVIFKIHSPKGQQNYNGKTFPAKFSINICNQPTQLATGLYNRDHFQSMDTQYNSPRKNEDPPKSQRTKSNFDLEQYDKQIKLVLEDKKKCDNLIIELEQTCQEYQRQILDLNQHLREKDLRISQLQKECGQKDKIQSQLRQMLFQKDSEMKQMGRKMKLLEGQLKRIKDHKIFNEKDHHFQIKNLESKIYELEGVINEKQVTIKNLSNFNNEISKKMLDEHLYASSSHVKQMEKWLKMMSKKCSNTNKQNGKDSSNSHQNSLISQLLSKNQKISQKLYQIQKNKSKLEIDLTKIIKENDQLMKVNSQLNVIITELEDALQQKQNERDTHETFYKRSMGSTFSQYEGGVIYEGTVKVKMECLLIEKDKRINELESQLQDSKKQSTMLRTKLYQLDCEQQFFNETQTINNADLKRARSVGSFYRERMKTDFNNGYEQSQKKQNQNEFNKILSQCSNLTKTLGNFMESRQTDRPILQKQEHRSYQNIQKINPGQQNNIDKLRELMMLQRNTFNILEQNLHQSNMEQVRWNNPNCENKKERNLDRQFSHNPGPITERIYFGRRGNGPLNNYGKQAY